MRRSLGALAAALLAGAAHAFGGVVTRISDGDTLWVQPDDRARKPIKVRLLHVDAPERCQPGGEQAGAALASRVLHRRVEVHARSRDDYRRVLAEVHLDAEDVAAWMVSNGYAWSVRWHGKPTRYAVQEQAARQAGLGLFARPDAVPPWRFRSTHGPCE